MSLPAAANASIPAILASVMWFALPSAMAEQPSERIRIACVGDSITHGARLKNRATDSYPAQLQRLLGDGVEVTNFGVGSCTLIRKGRPNVWSQLGKIEKVNPDVVIVSLGTNDTCGGRRRCWDHKDEFPADCRDLIDALRAFPSKPTVWLCAPAPMVLETPGLSTKRKADLETRKPRLQELIAVVKAVANEKKVGLIDLNTPLAGRPELFTEADGVHPNQAGYLAVAELVAKALQDTPGLPLGKHDGAVPFGLDEPLTVLCYNVFNGFRSGRSFKPAVKWINTIGPDIVGLQELVGWNEDQLKKTSPQWGHPHAATLKGGGYNIGLTSRTPIEVIERRTQGYWHGYLHCRTAGIEVIVTHLWPGSRRGQVREASILRDLVIRLDEEGRTVILMGDFNAHSAADKSMLDLQTPLLQRRTPGDAKKAPADRFIVDGKYIYDVMNTIEEAPLRDLVRKKFDARYPNADYEGQLRLGSFPTQVLPHSNTDDTQAGFLERIDFIYATPDLAAYCSHAKVCRTPAELETISDHYPVVTVFAPSADQSHCE